MDQATVDQYRIKFASNFEMAAQQTLPKIWGGFTENPDIATTKEVWIGEINNVPLFSETTGQRFGNQQPEEASLMDRRMAKRDFDYSTHWDRKQDAAVDIAAHPTSELMDLTMASWNRKLDDLSIEAATASIYVDRRNPTLQAFPAGNIIPVNYTLAVPTGAGAATGFTPYKILAVVKKFEDAQIDLSVEKPVIVITPRQKLDMIAFVEASGNSVWAAMFSEFLKTGKGDLFGCEIRVLAGRLRAVSSGIRECLAFTKKAFHVGAAGYKTEFDIIPESKHKRLLSFYADTAIVRRWDNRVYPVYCGE